MGGGSKVQGEEAGAQGWYRIMSSQNVVSGLRSKEGWVGKKREERWN